MNYFSKILNLYFKFFINNIKFLNTKEIIKKIILVLISFLFSLGLYLFSYYSIIYIINLPIIGNLFIIKVIELALLTTFIMSFFSSITISFSTIYNAEDLEFLISLPIKFLDIFFVKFFLTFLKSCWMVLILLIPFFLAFFYIKNIDILYFIFLIFCIVFKIFISSSLGVFIVIILSYFFQSKKIRNFFIVFIIFFLTIIYSLFRLSEPEKLLVFENFPDLLQYLDFLSKPTIKIFPSSWVTQIVKGLISKNYNLVFFNFLKLFIACFTIILFFYF